MAPSKGTAEIEENISVSVRVRPLNDREKKSKGKIGWNVSGNNTLKLLSNDSHGNIPSYTFDHVFSPDQTTVDVYNKVAKDVVSSVLNGMNGTIFAYGQTASGKTFTMQGESSCPGMVPLSTSHIFDEIANRPHFQFLLHISYIEIFNEQIRDLLSDNNANLRIREDRGSGFYVENVTMQSIISFEELMEAKARGDERRHVGETNMNLKSSRSHTIFTIKIEMRDSRVFEEEEAEGEDAKKKRRQSTDPEYCYGVLVGKLNLVDLAGSENARSTGAAGDRLTEAGNINRSLLTLSRVISQLAASKNKKKGGFINWRDSKLTQILQTSLAGNCRTAVICCITPAVQFIDETKSTLGFASRAKEITTHASVNEVLNGEGEIQKLKNEVRALQTELASQQSAKEEKEEMKGRINKLMALLISGGVRGVAGIMPDAGLSPSTFQNPKRRKKKHRETWCPGGLNPPPLLIGAKGTPNLSTLSTLNEESESKRQSIASAGETVAHNDLVNELEKVKAENARLKEDVDALGAFQDPENLFLNANQRSSFHSTDGMDSPQVAREKSPASSVKSSSTKEAKNTAISEEIVSELKFLREQADEMSGFESKAKSLESDVTNLKQNIESLSLDIEERDTKILEKENELIEETKKNREFQAKWEEFKSDVEEQITSYKAKIEELEENSVLLRQTIDKGSELHMQDQENIKELTLALKDRNAEIDSLKLDVEQIKHSEGEAVEKLESMKSGLGEEKEEVNIQLKELRDMLETKEGEIDLFKKENEKLLVMNSELSQAKLDLEGVINNADNNASDSVKEYQQNVIDLNAQLESLNAALIDSEMEKEKSISKLKENEVVLAEKVAHISTLTSQLDTAKLSEDTFKLEITRLKDTIDQSLTDKGEYQNEIQVDVVSSCLSSIVRDIEVMSLSQDLSAAQDAAKAIEEEYESTFRNIETMMLEQKQEYEVKINDMDTQIHVERSLRKSDGEELQELQESNEHLTIELMSFRELEADINRVYAENKQLRETIESQNEAITCNKDQSLEEVETMKENMEAVEKINDDLLLELEQIRQEFEDKEKTLKMNLQDSQEEKEKAKLELEEIRPKLLEIEELENLIEKQKIEIEGMRHSEETKASEIEDHVNSLTKATQEIEELKKLAQQKTEEYQVELQKYHASSNEDLDAISKDLELFQQQSTLEKSQLEEQVKTLESDNACLKSQLEDAQKLSAEVGNPILDAEVSSLEKTQLEEQIKTLESDNACLKSQLEDAQKLSAEVGNPILDGDDSDDAKNKDLVEKELENLNKNLMLELQEVKHQSSTLLKQTEENFKIEIHNLKTQNAELETKITEFQAKLQDTASTQNRNLRDHFEVQIEKLEKDVQEWRQKAVTYEAEFQKQLNDTELTGSNTNKRISQLELCIQLSKQEADKSLQRISELEKELERNSVMFTKREGDLLRDIEAKSGDVKRLTEESETSSHNLKRLQFELDREREERKNIESDMEAHFQNNTNIESKHDTTKIASAEDIQVSAEKSDALMTTIKALEKKVETQKQSIEEKSQRIERLEESIEFYMKEAEKTSTVETDTVSEETPFNESSDVASKEKNESMLVTIKALEKKVGIQKEDIEEKSNTIRDLQESLQTLSKQLEQVGVVEENTHMAHDVVEELEQKLKLSTEKSDQMLCAIKSLEEKIGSLKESNDEMDKTICQLEGEKEHASFVQEGLNNKIDALVEEKGQMSSAIEALESKLSSQAQFVLEKDETIKQLESAMVSVEEVPCSKSLCSAAVQTEEGMDHANDEKLIEGQLSPKKDLGESSQLVESIKADLESLKAVIQKSGVSTQEISTFEDAVEAVAFVISFLSEECAGLKESAKLDGDAANARTSEYEKERTLLEDELKVWKDKVVALEEMINDSAGALSRNEELSNELEAARTELSKLKVEIQVIGEEMLEKDQCIGEQNEELLRLVGAETDLKESNQKLGEKLAGLEKQNAQLLVTCKDEESLRLALEEKCAEHESSLKDYRIMEEKMQKSEEVEAVVHEKKLLEEKNEQLGLKLEKVITQLESSSREYQQMEEKVSKYTELESAFHDREKLVQKLKAKLQKVTEISEKYEARVKKLEKTKLSESACLKIMETKKEYKLLRVKHAEVLAANESLTKDLRKLQEHARNYASKTVAHTKIVEKVGTVAMRFGIMETPDPIDFVEMITERLSVLQKERDALEAENRANENNQDLREFIEMLQDEKQVLERKIATIEEKYLSITSKYDKVSAEFEELGARYEEAIEKMEAVGNDSHRFQQIASSQREDVENLQGQLSQMTTKLQSMAEEKQQLKALAIEEYRKLEANFEQLKQEHDSVNQTLSSTKEEHKQTIRFLEKENLELMMDMRKLREEQRGAMKRMNQANCDSTAISNDSILRDVGNLKSSRPRTRSQNSEKKFTRDDAASVNTEKENSEVLKTKSKVAVDIENENLPPQIHENATTEKPPECQQS